MSGRAFDLLRAVRDLPLPPAPPKLTTTDKMILALLAMRADTSGFCWTSYATLAANGWMSTRAAKKAIGRLVAVGLVEIRVRRIDGGQDGRLARAANGYQVLVKVVNEVHEVVNHVHQGGEPYTPGVVNGVHGGGEPRSHRSASGSATDGSAPEKTFELTLDEEVRSTERKTKKAPNTKAEIPGHQEVIACFVEEYEKLRHEKPILDGKTGKAAKRLLETLKSPELACAAIRRAFAEDRFVQSSKPDLAYIAGNVNAYRGTAPAKASGYRVPVQPAAPRGQRAFVVGRVPQEGTKAG